MRLTRSSTLLPGFVVSAVVVSKSSLAPPNGSDRPRCTGDEHVPRCVGDHEFERSLFGDGLRGYSARPKHRNVIGPESNGVSPIRFVEIADSQCLRRADMYRCAMNVWASRRDANRLGYQVSRYGSHGDNQRPAESACRAAIAVGSVPGQLTSCSMCLTGIPADNRSCSNVKLHPIRNPTRSSRHREPIWSVRRRVSRSGTHGTSVGRSGGRPRRGPETVRGYRDR